MANEDKKDDQVNEDELNKAADEGIAKGKEANVELEKKDEQKTAQELADAEKLKAETEAKLKAEKEKKALEDDPAERSKLGRKVKSLEAELTTQSQQIAELMEMNRKLLTGATGKSDTVVPEEDEEAPILKKDIPSILQKEREKENAVARGAEAKFIKKVMSLSGEIEDEELIKEITDEMDATGLNQFSFVNPEYDAEKSFMKAQISVLKRRNASGKSLNPLDKNKDGTEHAATGVTGGDKLNIRKEQRIELDEDAKAFAQWSGMKEEDIQDALTKSSNSLVLRGK